MASPKRNADRNKAHRLRAKLNAGGAVTETEAKFLQNYDASRSDRPSPVAAPPVVLTEALANGHDVGASEEGRTVKFELKENKKAVGTGDAAAIAAAGMVNLQALATAMRESTKGVADASKVSIDALQAAVEVYKSITLDLREGMRDLLQSEIQAREQYREHYLKRVDVEGQLRQALKDKDDDGDPVNQMVMMAAAKLLGIDLPGVDLKALGGADAGAAPKAKR